MAHQLQLPLAAWQRRQQAATEAAAAASPTASQESDCIDLTDEWNAAPNAPAAAAPAAAAAASSSSAAASVAGSADRNGAMDHSMSADALLGSGASLDPPPAALSASKRGSSSQRAPRSGPKLQLTAVSHTHQDNPSAAASSSSHVSAASSAGASVPALMAAGSASGDRKPPAAALRFGSSIHGETSGIAAVGAHKPQLKLSQQIAMHQQSAGVTATAFPQLPPTPAPFSRAAAAAAPPLSVVAAKYAKREPTASSSSAAPAAAASPASAIRPSQTAAPAMRRSSTLPSTAASSGLSSHPPPLLNASGAQYQETEDELRVRRCTEIDDRLEELERIVAQIQAEQRALKNEHRELQAELNRPMQLPFSTPSRPTAPALGGASALISGSAFWSGRFEWDAAALDAMQRTFGLSSYRVSQREVVNATMSRKDCFVIMPTGAGKSLLYQLPALLNEGVTLVISPLLSLMEDQLIYLRSVGIEAYMLCGTSSKSEVAHVHAQMLDRHSRMRLLYVSPEKLTKSKQFLSKLEGMHALGKLIRIVIDEAHCCSQWGHDFRPDYKKLNILRVQFKGVPILAVTATATGRVAKDVQSILGIRDCQEFKCSFNRPNLHFSVRPKSGTTKELAADMIGFIESIGQMGSSGIVYCYSKKETMEMCSALSALGLSCDFYNSDVTPEQRQRVHHRWVKGDIKVVVATNAFGLGINKADVRFVLHQTIPQGVETMYQEAGRAGRDGHKAWCCLFYSPRDLPRQSTRVYAKQNMTAHLYPLIAYCHQIDQCRRVQMARYFGEVITPEQCNRMCDVCERMGAAEDAAAAAGVSFDPASLFITRDLSEAAVQICDFVISNGGGAAAAGSGGRGGKGKRKASSASLTQKQVVDECRKKSSSIDALPKGLSREDVERVIIELMLQGLLVESFRNTAYTTLSYLGVDSQLVSGLRQGNLTIRLKFWADARTHTGAAAGASPTRRKSVSGGKSKSTKSATKKESAAAAASSLFAASSSSSQAAAEAGWVDLADDFLEDADGPAGSSAAAAADAHPDDDVDEDQYQIELDDAGGEMPYQDYDEEEEAMHAQAHAHDDEEDEEDEEEFRPRRNSSGGGSGRRLIKGGSRDSDDDDDESYEEPNDASSEDQPVKKSRREPQSARLAPQPRRASSAAVASASKPSRASSTQRPPQRASAQHNNSADVSIPPSDDEEAAFQNAMRQSMTEF